MARNNPRSANLSGPDGPKPPRPAKGGAAAKSEARERASRLAQEQARARKRRLLLTQGGIGLLVAVVVVAAVVLVLSRGGGGSDDAAAPPQVTADGSFVVGNPDAPVTLQMVEDFQCPVCKQFESTNQDLLDSYAAGDDVKLEYRGISFLDGMSSTKYSTRALNASACVMGQGTDVWRAFHKALYEQQPPEQGDGLPDSELIDIATTAGADPSAITSCIEDEKYADWVKSTTDKSGDDGVSGTPTLFVDGKVLKIGRAHV